MFVKWLGRGRGPDEGAVATVFAVLLSGGVLLGLMALVVDVGQIYVERGELISGADAAALGVAKACATDLPGCDNRHAVEALAQFYADENSSDGVSHVERVCGVLPHILDPCPPPVNSRAACLGDPPGEGNWVEVRLSTEIPGNRFVLPPTFARGVIDDFDGASVGACARVSWHEPVVVDILKLAMSDCAYEAAADRGFAAEPIDASTNLNDQLWLGQFQSCHGDPSAALVVESGDNCEFQMPENGLIEGRFLRDEHTDIPAECLTRLRSLVDSKTPVYMPVYDRAGSELTTTLHIERLAKVVVTGYDLGPRPGERYGPDRGHVPDDCAPDPRPRPGHGPDPWWAHRCVSVYVVGQLELSALVANAAVDLIG